MKPQVPHFILAVSIRWNDASKVPNETANCPMWLVVQSTRYPNCILNLNRAVSLSNGQRIRSYRTDNLPTLTYSLDYPQSTLALSSILLLPHPIFLPWFPSSFTAGKRSPTPKSYNALVASDTFISLVCCSFMALGRTQSRCLLRLQAIDLHSLPGFWILRSNASFLSQRHKSVGLGLIN